MTDDPDFSQAIRDALVARFGETVEVPPDCPEQEGLARIAGHRTHRRYRDRPVDDALLRLLLACALSAPSKSDLQQADVVQVARPDLRAAIGALIPSMPWVAGAPVFLVFCGNGRRIRRIAELRGKPFPNDHLDAFFNAAVDAALVLNNFMQAAAAAGLGFCPISVIRDHSAAVSDLLGLPDLVFPLAGLCLGYPAEERGISPRLPLSLTLHRDRWDEGDFAAEIDSYDRRRHALYPLGEQSKVERFGAADFYGWSEAKARQYADPQRQDFGAFIRSKGFCLD